MTPSPSATALGAPPLLRADAYTTLAASEKEIALARTKRTLHRTRLDLDTGELNKITINSARLEHAAEIEGLAGRMAGFLGATEDLPGMLAQIDARTENILRLAKHIGWSETAVPEIETKLPTRPVVPNSKPSRVRKRSSRRMHNGPTRTTRTRLPRLKG